MSVEKCYELFFLKWNICFIPVATQPAPKIFGFSEYISALALLAIVYTITDIRYKFRIAIAPFFLPVITYWVMGIIGILTLLAEIWLANNWLVPEHVNITPPLLQGLLGYLFLGIILKWLYYGVIHPPVFSQSTQRQFARELYRVILRGNDHELSVVGDELGKSAKALIGALHSRSIERDFSGDSSSKAKPDIADYANQIILLIADRKFCRQIVNSSPETAQIFFNELNSVYKTSTDAYKIPMGAFSRNLSNEAIVQKDSFLYKEISGYDSGLLGYFKPVSQTIYGNHKLAEALSPLDIDFNEQHTWDATQWDGYCRATFITLTDFSEKGQLPNPPGSLIRAMENIQRSYRDLYKLNNSMETYSDDCYDRFHVAIDFVRRAINFLDQQPTSPQFLKQQSPRPYNLCDHLALLIFDMCFAASAIDSPPETCWGIHYVALWSQIFIDEQEGIARKIIRFKTRRLLYNEIVRLSKFPNYKSARILGYCLNVCGINMKSEKQNFSRESYPLAKAAQAWAKNHYLALREKNVDVANAVLIGRLSFDETNNRLIMTYLKGLDKETPKTFLNLDPIK